MDKIYNKNKSKPLSPNDLQVSGGGDPYDRNYKHFRHVGL